MRRRSFLEAACAAGGIFALRPLTAAARPQPAGRDHPPPRYPEVPQVRGVDDLLPNVRVILERPHLNSRPGYAIRGGERVLMFVDAYTDRLVVDAFESGFRERGCALDVVIMQAPTAVWSSADALALVVRDAPGTRRQPWNRVLPYHDDLLDDYDVVIAPDYLPAAHVLQEAYGGRDLPMVWPTRELLADAAVIRYPEPLLELIEEKAWQVIRGARRARITDPEGTDLTFSISERHWDVLEGVHPTYRIPGSGPGRSRRPQVPGHLMGVPRYPLAENDAEGVVAGTVDHLGPYPRLEIDVAGGRAVALRGGGRFGDLWREYIQATRGIRYPHQPAAGCDFLMEGAVGTHPKIRRPHDVMETPAARSAWHYDRRRSGVLHFGFGQADDTAWAEAAGLPSSHFHVHQYFCSYRTEQDDGSSASLIEGGRLVALDDPDVRSLAARFGDPDELLAEAWIPAIPGINAPGAYGDYARDPASWIARDHREHYPASRRL